jgi:outer membrane lipoprotein-sorting protein
MRTLILILALSLAVFSAQAQAQAQTQAQTQTPTPTQGPSPEYAKKAAAATAAVAATAAAAHQTPLTPGPEDGQTVIVPPPVIPPAASKPAVDKTIAKKPDDDDKAVPAELSEQDKADIKRIEAYLNDLKSISADFLQMDDQGGMTRGTIAIKRPGKMRVNYAPPSHDFIVADGDFVHMWDGSLKSQTNVPEDSSLANFILRKNISLSGGVTVTKFQRFPNKLEITLVQTDDPGLGRLTLIFEDHPLLLRQWKVFDAQGRTTGVNLENERSGVEFPHDTFNFVPPSFGRGGKAD